MPQQQPQPQKQKKFRPERIKSNPELYTRSEMPGGQDPRYCVISQWPEARYYWASLAGAGPCSQGYMQTEGWTPVLASDDPADPRTLVPPDSGADEPGQPIVRDELILMMIHEEDYEHIRQYGGRRGMGLQGVKKIDASLATGNAPGDQSNVGGDNSVRLGGYDSSRLIREN